MALTPGTALGGFEITGSIGAGGMGEVYRATDSKLGREVAIKTLPTGLAADADRLARFEREAKLLASLNHAHIASVYELDEHDGTLYIAMELVEGDTLEEKLKSGPLPVEEALQLGLQIAQALEAAHDKGVVHRDLKPANIMITPDGVVKVLDFGLAKAFSGDPNQASPAHSPALSVAMTQAGLVLGTAGYMAPEQASGQATDQRADIWAFGVVLYEMLTGQPLFSGESVPHILAAVLQTEPDWGRLPKNLNPRLTHMLERCLDKKVRNRYHSIADVRVDIEAVLRDPAGVVVRGATEGGAARAQAPLSRRALPWAAGLVLAAIAGAAAWTIKTPEPRPLIRSVHTLPDGRSFSLLQIGVITISRDGQEFIYGANDAFYLHRMDSFDDVRINVPEAVHLAPELSPDGHSLAYISFLADPGTTGGVQLAKIPVAGGASIPIGPAGSLINGTIRTGLRWEADGRIVYVVDGVIWRVSANGGDPEQLLAAKANEAVSEAELLPGGDWVLFSVANSDTNDWDAADVVAQSLRSNERRVLHKGGSSARYVPTGHLVYAFGDTLYAAPFDADAVEVIGEPVPVVQGVRRDRLNSGIAQYDFSDNGTLIYMPGGASGTGDARLAIVDRDARARTLPLASGAYSDPRVSPDGSVAAFTAVYPDGEDVTAYRLAGNSAPLRLTFGGTSQFPVWSADSQRVAFQSTRDGAPSIYWQLADGSGGAPERLTTPADGETHIPESFSPDGKGLLFTVQKDNESAIWILDLETRESQPLITAPGVDYTQPVFSPNGKWIAYMSTETGSNEIFVQPYPLTGARRQLPHTIDNHHPVWSADGNELIYTPGPNRFESVPITTAPTFSFGPAQALGNIQMNQAPERRRQYDIMPDGSGFLGFVTGTDDQGVLRNQINIVYNWFDELERLAPTK